MGQTLKEKLIWLASGNYLILKNKPQTPWLLGLDCDKGMEYTFNVAEFEEVDKEWILSDSHLNLGDIDRNFEKFIPENNLKELKLMEERGLL